jgi:hypothetical protein
MRLFRGSGLSNQSGSVEPTVGEAGDTALPPPTTASTAPRRSRFGGFRGRTKGTEAGYGAGGGRFFGHGGQPVTFGGWFKATALDILTMFILGAIGLGVSIKLWLGTCADETGLLCSSGPNTKLSGRLFR